MQGLQGDHIASVMVTAKTNHARAHQLMTLPGKFSQKLFRMVWLWETANWFWIISFWCLGVEFEDHIVLTNKSGTRRCFCFSKPTENSQIFFGTLALFITLLKGCGRMKYSASKVLSVVSLPPHKSREYMRLCWWEEIRCRNLEQGKIGVGQIKQRTL